jgi:hypothetical protein
MKIKDRKKCRTANSTYKKLAVQWLNEALFFVSSSVLADSFRLRNRQLLVAAKRWLPDKRMHFNIKKVFTLSDSIKTVD